MAKAPSVKSACTATGHKAVRFALDAMPDILRWASFQAVVAISSLGVTMLISGSFIERVGYGLVTFAVVNLMRSAGPMTC